MNSFRYLWTTFKTKWPIIKALVDRDIKDRYSAHVFGGIWAVGHPLLLMLIYLFVFNFIFKIRLGGEIDFTGDYITLVISALTVWLVIQDVLMRACQSIREQPGLVSQASFPLEVLPIKTALSSWPLLLICTGFLIIYQIATSAMPPLATLAVPFYWLLLYGFLIGAAFWLSAISVFIPDTSDIMQVIVSIGLFVSPILFVPVLVPPGLDIAFYFNPFSYVIWPHKDLMFYGHIEHPFGWLGLIVLNLLFIWGGVRTFRRLRPRFGDVL